MEVELELYSDQVTRFVGLLQMQVCGEHGALIAGMVPLFHLLLGHLVDNGVDFVWQRRAHEFHVD